MATSHPKVSFGDMILKDALMPCLHQNTMQYRHRWNGIPNSHILGHVSDRQLEAFIVILDVQLVSIAFHFEMFCSQSLMPKKNEKCLEQFSKIAWKQIKRTSG